MEFWTHLRCAAGSQTPRICLAFRFSPFRGPGPVKEEMVCISTQTFGWRSWSLLKERLTDVQIKESLRGAAQALTLMMPNTKEITAILNSSKRAQRVKKGPLGLGNVID